MRTARSVRSVHALAGLLLAAALALTGCSAADSSDSGGSSDKAAAQSDGRPGARSDDGGGAARSDGTGSDGAGSDGAAGGKAQASAPPKLTPSHIIRTVSLSVQVKDTAKALAAARTATENAGGYVGDEDTARDEEGREETQVTLRVPVERYESVLADLEGAGKLLERSAKAEDVGDQVVDVESRVKSQRASVARVRELMDRATRLSDVVELEGELSSRQAELESLLARQAALKDRTSLATITLSLSEAPVKPVVKDEDDDDPGFLDALAGGWDVFVTMLRWIVVVLGAALPFLAVAVLAVLVWTRVYPARRTRRERPAPNGPTGPAVPAQPLTGPLPTHRAAQHEEGEGGARD
ncbi:DUF4349 domain-containing protein [Streptomyces sp. NPDC003717]|uniref:DUF4349 domain-containing protein n=1 Tax=Streptomyces sp. NPDC003717 TaxID=3154276 RepID=UPI0033A93A59